MAEDAGPKTVPGASEQSNPTPQALSSPATEPPPTPESPGSAPPNTPPPAVPESSSHLVPDKQELFNRARAFLASPQAQYQDVSAKRKFLTEKGLNPDEVDSLLHEAPQQPLTIPPRTYPQPPPSNLPNLLLGATRILSWLAGGSLVLVYIYYRFLLPRIIQTSTARASLRGHHLTLLRRLASSLSSLKEAQSENYAVLPRPQLYKEPESFSACTSVAEILKYVEEKNLDVKEIPHITLLRCTIEDLGKGKTGDEAKPTTEEVFRHLEGSIPWLATDEGIDHEEKIWQTLSTCPLFIATPATAGNNTSPRISRWAYNPPSPPEPSPVVKFLSSLLLEMPKNSSPKDRPFQRTMQILSDFTGYISTQVYLPYRTSNILKKDNTPPTLEEQMKQEIRGLRGLILSRRTFLPTTQKQTEVVQHPTT